MTARNYQQTSGDQTNSHPGGLPKAPLAALLPRASYFQSTPQTFPGVATDLIGTDLQLSTMVRIRTAQGENWTDMSPMVTTGSQILVEPWEPRYE